MKIFIVILLGLIAVMLLFFAAFATKVAAAFVFVLIAVLFAFLSLIIHLEIIGSR